MLVATRHSPMSSDSAQTGAPASASAAFTPTARNSVDLPDMLEPVTISACGFGSPSKMSFETRFFGAISGWPSVFALKRAVVAKEGNENVGSSNASEAKLHKASISPSASSHARTRAP